MEVPKKMGRTGIAIHETKAILEMYQRNPCHRVSTLFAALKFKNVVLISHKSTLDVSYFCKYWHFSHSPRLNQCVSPLKMLHPMDNGCSTSEHKIANIKCCKNIVSLPNVTISICYKNLAISILFLI